MERKNWIKGKIRVMFKANCDLPQGSLSTKSHPQNLQKSNETFFSSKVEVALIQYVL